MSQLNSLNCEKFQQALDNVKSLSLVATTEAPFKAFSKILQAI